MVRVSPDDTTVMSTPSRAATQQRSILIVDDVADMRFLLRVALERDERWRIAGEAADGREAVDAAAAEQPDVVLLDLEMPWMSGAECLPLVRRAAPDAKVIIWTVEPEGRRAQSAIDLGAIAVLDKASCPPFLLPEHLAALLD